MSVPYSRTHAALRATGTVYMCLDFGMSAWLSRPSNVHDDLGLTPATIDTMLLIVSLGSLLTLPTSGPIVTKIGARASGHIGVFIWVLDIVCAGVGALNMLIPLATLDLVPPTAGNGLWGVTMNIEAGLVQATVRRIVVLTTQAIYAAGMFGGALLDVLAPQVGMPLGARLFSLTALEPLACGTVVSFYLTKEEVTTLASAQDKGDGGEAASNKVKGLMRVAWREKQTVLIALMVMNAGLIEGATNDWLNLSVADGYGYSTATAFTAFALFLLMMAVAHFVSPHFEACLGSPILLRITSSDAAVGLLLVAFVLHHLLAVAGIALWGIGSALGFPLGISALSVDSVTTSARVLVLSTVNCGMAFIDPPFLGLIVDHIGCYRALVLVTLPVLLVIVLTGQVSNRHGAKRTDLASGSQKAAPRVRP